jgi:hypothetical protein
MYGLKAVPFIRRLFPQPVKPVPFRKVSFFRTLFGPLTHSTTHAAPTRITDSANCEGTIRGRNTYALVGSEGLEPPTSCL